MNIRKAVISDIDLLIDLHLDYLRLDYGELTIEQEPAVLIQLNEYLPKHLTEGDFIALIGEEKSMLVNKEYI